MVSYSINKQRGKDMKFLQWFKRSWMAQLSAIMLIIWPPLLITTIVGYWRLSDEAITVMVLCVIFALVGGIFVLKIFAKNRATVPAVHWMDVFVNRILISLAVIFVLGIMSGILVAFETETGNVSAAVFAGIGALFLIFGWILSHIYIKQAIVTEGTLKALELYNGNQRKKSYKSK